MIVNGLVGIRDGHQINRRRFCECGERVAVRRFLVAHEVVAEIAEEHGDITMRAFNNASRKVEFDLVFDHAMAASEASSPRAFTAEEKKHLKETLVFLQSVSREVKDAITRAGLPERVWTRFAGNFELGELYDVSFTDRRRL